MKYLLIAVAIALCVVSVATTYTLIKSDMAVYAKQGECIAAHVADGVERSDIKVLTSGSFCKIIR